ncbi:MAG: PAS domain S-box protein [Desulfobacterales bacterium]|nr:PAS domain S-box protein [Desulfobacterales bacterium]
MSVARDITQRERNEEALMHQSKMRIETEKALLSEKRLLDEYINSLPGLFYVFDEKRFVRWNREWKRVTGYSDEELSVRYGPDFFEGEDRTRIEERMLSVFHDGYAEIDTELVTKNGRKIPYHFNGIRKKLNGKDHLVGLAMDITDRKRAEENLKKARAYISNIIDSMPSMLIGVDADGRVTQWNSEARRATGVSQEEAVGRPLAAAIPRLADEMDRVHEAMRGREAQIDPRKARQEGGGTRYEDITVYPLIANGAEGAVIRVDDVTDKVRMEEMMIQGEKMLSVGGLAAGMAHEINNPLAGMMQTAGVLANRLTREDMPANRKASEAAGVTMESIRSYMTARGAPRMIAAINESGRRVADIVNNILSFARKSDDRTSSHDLAELLDKTLALAGADYDLKKRYDFKRIEIIKDYDDNAPPAPCESPKIQQVLFNILRNGAQAMQEAEVQKPRFIVRTRVEKERCMVRVEIEDNGPGMEEAIRKRVFEPFYTTKPVGVGAGLGLSVSYFIITENHGGEMTVESAPGKGARFIVRIPTGRRNQLPGI